MLSSSLPLIPSPSIYFPLFSTSPFHSIMEFFLEMFLMVIVSLFLSFLVARLVSLAMAVNDLTESPESVGGGVGDDFVKAEELDSSLETDAPVLESEGCYLQEQTVDRFDEVEEESVEVEERSEEVIIAQELEEETQELSVEEEDGDADWEGIERSEVEKAFAAAVNFLEVGDVEIGAKAKMELYGLHKIATQGWCREAQPMGFMVSARAKWNAWYKLGNMTQEEAMEKYLALVSKEIPGHSGSD